MKTSANNLPVRLALRSDLHLVRKLWHVSMGSLIAWLHMEVIPRPAAVTILGAVLIVFLVLETARLRFPALNAASIRLWGPLMREGEHSRMSGLPYYVAAALLAIGIFPKTVAFLAIMFLAVGDPIASYIGIRYGDRSIRFSNGKSLLGTLAGILACAVVALVFLSSMGLPMATVIALSTLGGIVGGTTELLPLEIDDNFSIPVISGFALWLGFIILGV